MPSPPSRAVPVRRRRPTTAWRRSSRARPRPRAFLATAWQQCPRRAGAAEVVPDTFLHPALREGMGPRRRQAARPPARLLVLRDDDAARRGHLRRRRARRGRRRPHRRSTSCSPARRSAYGLCRPPGHHAPGPPTAGTATSTTRPSSPTLAPAHRRQGHHPRRRLPPRQRHPADLLRARRRAVRLAPRRPRTGPTRTSPATPRRPAPAGAGAPTSTCRCRPGPTTTASWPPWPRPLDADRRPSVPPRVVVSLGVDTFRLDPIADFALTTAASPRCGAIGGRAGPPDGRAPGGRLLRAGDRRERPQLAGRLRPTPL